MAVRRTRCRSASTTGSRARPTSRCSCCPIRSDSTTACGIRRSPRLTARFRVLRYDTARSRRQRRAGRRLHDRTARPRRARAARSARPRSRGLVRRVARRDGRPVAGRARGDRLSALVLANTSPRIADPAGMEARRQTVLDGGTRAIVDTAMARFFGDALLAANPPRIASARDDAARHRPGRLRRLLRGAARLRRHGAAAADHGARRSSSAATPTSRCRGTAHGAVLARAIPGAAAVRLATAHLRTWACRGRSRERCCEFLAPMRATRSRPASTSAAPCSATTTSTRGLAATTDLTRDYQAGSRASRGAASGRARASISTRAACSCSRSTAALGRWEEFRLHLAPASPPTSSGRTSRRCCCRPASTPACRPRTRRSRSPPRCAGAKGKRPTSGSA